MDYIRISQQDYKTTRQQVDSVAESEFNGHSSKFKLQDIKELLKDWIKLYPNSFAPDVEFKIYQLADGDIIIKLHEDLSSMAIALLVLYFESIRLQDYKTTRLQDDSVEATTAKVQQSEFNSQSSKFKVQQTAAYITIDDTEILLKQNEGKRAMVFLSQQDYETTRQQPKFNSQSSTAKVQGSTVLCFLLEDNYVLDYNFEGRPKSVKDSGRQFYESEFTLPEEYEVVRVGDVVKKKVDEFLDEGLTPKKMLIYILCGVIGLSIGFLIVYFMGR